MKSGVHYIAFWQGSPLRNVSRLRTFSHFRAPPFHNPLAAPETVYKVAGMLLLPYAHFFSGVQNANLQTRRFQTLRICALWALFCGLVLFTFLNQSGHIAAHYVACTHVGGHAIFASNVML